MLEFTILGCGSSAGVPRVGGGWGACDPSNPKNRRRRCSLLVERRGSQGVTRILVDTSPDLREQLLDANVDRIDAVFYTHPHADHTHGIDDLRALAIHQRRRVDVYLDASTSRDIRAKFGYCFETPQGSSYPPILNEHRLEPGQPVTVDGPGGSIIGLPIRHEHGDIPSLGFRFGGLAYSCDLNGLPADSTDLLNELEVWIVDALRYTRHPSHWSLNETLEWIARLKPERAIITNMHVDLDYAKLAGELPRGVVPAYDGMRVEASDVLPMRYRRNMPDRPGNVP